MSFPLTREPSAVPEHTLASVSNTAVLICGQKANFYGGLFENNHSSDVYLQLFNAAAAADVTVGTTAAVMTMRLPASGAIVLDHNKPWKHFPSGIVAAVTATRTGSGSPTTAATLNIYHSAQ